ncbi:unnamed protein product [Didymodactylos carnosus]|uniref:Radial spokehead-like protein n=1 Tax=Didymodactylos carnosus TaxID=1234261 RepID=A0A813SNR1_9BILA|nr:unnamed protein product [Didymodactylos carnosus]CAF0829672.1 unnamed protein product [Didymodactylos carnosus]CAF3587623.1 unnamed protein product [Didymodactylos carnosus]CAF3614170.1 unnamed protein product [Didymodactylos carnosus]
MTSAVYNSTNSADQNNFRNQSSSPANGDIEKQFVDAKAYILASTTKDGINLYDHLAHCLTRLLNEQPRNSTEIFEDISKDVKRETSRPQHDTLRDRDAPDSEHSLAEEQKPLFEKPDNADQLDDEALQSPLPNLLEYAYYFEQSGIGLGREETYRIWLALKQLVDKHQFEKVRFWGKIFGIQKNYYIAEVKFGDDEMADEEEEEQKDSEDGKEIEEEEQEQEEDPLPKSTFKTPQEVPKEERGTGAGMPWTKLPQVTPAQISQARNIKLFLTGDLNREITSYPSYPGVEKHYLRAQIARISATTHVSPAGRFKFNDEEEEAEEEGGRDNYQDNEEFKGAALSELIDEEFNGWVHHVQHILPQGRTKWWNPKQDSEKEEENEEEEEEMKAEGAEEIEPESGPPLLTPVGADAEIEGTRPWTAKISSLLIPQYACAFVRSNLWPGAYAFARGMIWENLYVGWGHKYAMTDYGPQLPPEPAAEYADGPDIGETEDPSPEEEARARASQEEAAEEGEEEHEEELEGDEDDD